MTMELALELSEKFGWAVFPVKHGDDNTKRPLTKHGHKDATADPNLIQDLWTTHPNARVGVPAGVNGLLVLDVDVKNDRDGFDSIDEAWLEITPTYAYDTPSGGRHFVYKAPEGKNLAPSTNYRGLSGVDIRAGESWVLWNGGVPDEAITPAPEWTTDEATEKSRKEFAGSYEEWVKQLVPGEPNALVRRAMNEIPADLGHADMVSAQHHAIRLGCEGSSGSPELLEALYEAWMNRDPTLHTTPESQWQSKWFEALETGIEKYGALTEELKNLPTYNINLVPSSVRINLVTDSNTGKAGFSQLLGALVKETNDDQRIASILWGSPATSELAKDWGLQFVFKRIAEARVRPEPVRENPRIEEQRELSNKGGDGEFHLVSEEERDYLASRPSYVDRVINTAKSYGYDQLPYFHSIGWVTAAMAFSFKGFIPKTKSHKMGLNLWSINPGYSGTGKTVASGFRKGILDEVFSHEKDNAEIAPYSIGDGSSPQGMHMSLIERDHRGSIFVSNEASGFFKSLGNEWKTGMSDSLTSWFDGFVEGSNKLSQKDLRGKSALTNLCMHMLGTPDKLAQVIPASLFEDGFMARVLWSFGNPPRDDDSRFTVDFGDNGEDLEYDQTPPELKEHALDLITAVYRREKPAPINGTQEAKARLGEAYKKMYRWSERRENWDLIEPSLTRISESMQKMAAISAIYRGDTVIQMEDVLHAVTATEEYFKNLHRMAALVSAGQFQRRADEIEMWVRGQNGVASKPKILHRFRNFIEKSPRELEDLLTYLTESGTLNRVEGDRGKIQYEVNGG